MQDIGADRKCIVSSNKLVQFEFQEEYIRWCFVSLSSILLRRTSEGKFEYGVTIHRYTIFSPSTSSIPTGKASTARNIILI